MATVNHELIRQAAAILREAGATEVYLFGSAVDGTFDDYSDYDLAVRGLPEETYFKSYVNASLVLDRELDLVNLDHNSPVTRYLVKTGAMTRVA